MKDSDRLQQLEVTPVKYLTRQQKKELKKLQKAKQAGCLKMGAGHPVVISINDPLPVVKIGNKKKKKVSKGKQGFQFSGRY